MSYADSAFICNCINILGKGISDEGFNVRPKWEDGTPAHTVKNLYVVDKYNLSKDPIPMVTLRKGGIKNAIDEILWIYQKKSSKLEDLHSHIWDSWDMGDGTIGKAYGYQIGKKAMYKDPDGTYVTRDQMDQVLWDLKNNPGSRSIMTNMYNFEDLHEMGLRPCAYSMTYNVTKDSEGNMILNGMLNQRSQDMLTANNWNTIQYAALIQMLAKVNNMKPGIFTHVIADAHIYDRHIPIILDMIKNYCECIYEHIEDPAAKRYIDEAYTNLKMNYDLGRYYGIASYAFMHKELVDLPHKNPGLWINPEVKDFYDFTPDDFKLIGYEHDDFSPKIPVAI